MSEETRALWVGVRRPRPSIRAGAAVARSGGRVDRTRRHCAVLYRKFAIENMMAVPETRVRHFVPARPASISNISTTCSDRLSPMRPLVNPPLVWCCKIDGVRDAEQFHALIWHAQEIGNLSRPL